jgi:hypothetical protein
MSTAPSVKNMIVLSVSRSLYSKNDVSKIIVPDSKPIKYVLAKSLLDVYYCILDIMFGFFGYGIPTTPVFLLLCNTNIID